MKQSFFKDGDLIARRRVTSKILLVLVLSETRRGPISTEYA